MRISMIEPKPLLHKRITHVRPSNSHHAFNSLQEVYEAGTAFNEALIRRELQKPEPKLILVISTPTFKPYHERLAEF